MLLQLDPPALFPNDVYQVRVDPAVLGANPATELQLTIQLPESGLSPQILDAGGFDCSVLIAAISCTILALARPVSSLHDALFAGGGFLIGCAWAATLALVLWPLRPYRPVRLALRAVLTQLAAIADSLIER